MSEWIVEIRDGNPHIKSMKELVRCKDCKFLSHFTDGHLECRLLRDLRSVSCIYVTMQENDFCFYGERREVQRNLNASNTLDALEKK